ncbi:MAG: hypothetical protein H0X12_11155 [Nocardioides sp.]|nr:hypothetical protein [Nocardioides sp.]
MSIASIFRDGESAYVVLHGTAAWMASLEWARFHGLDPDRIPAGSTVIRDEPGRRIVFDEFVKDGPKVSDIVVIDGEPQIVRRIEQGEAPPLPLPAEVTG